MFYPLYFVSPVLFAIDLFFLCVTQTAMLQLLFVYLILLAIAPERRPVYFVVSSLLYTLYSLILTDIWGLPLIWLIPLYWYGERIGSYFNRSSYVPYLLLTAVIYLVQITFYYGVKGLYSPLFSYTYVEFCSILMTMILWLKYLFAGQLDDR